MSEPDPSQLSPERAHRLQLINEELRRLYPAVCVPDSPERLAFLQTLKDTSDDDPEGSLAAAFIALGADEDTLPPPFSPVLHPTTVLEQLCFVRLWEIEFRSTPALEAFGFIQEAAGQIVGRMRDSLGSVAEADPIHILPVVPTAVLANSRVTVSFHGASLGFAIRMVAEAVGLEVRLLNDHIHVCSPEVAAALDADERNGWQRPLWELQKEGETSTHPVREEDARSLYRYYPALSVPVSPEQIRFNAHYALHGTTENAWSLADRLFAGESASSAVSGEVDEDDEGKDEAE